METLMETPNMNRPESYREDKALWFGSMMEMLACIQIFLFMYFEGKLPA